MNSICPQRKTSHHPPALILIDLLLGLLSSFPLGCPSAIITLGLCFAPSLCWIPFLLSCLLPHLLEYILQEFPTKVICLNADVSTNVFIYPHT